MAGKTKLMMFCPWCDEAQARTWQGMTAHVRAKHPDKISELKDNKDMYLEKFACDEFGEPLAGSPAPDPKPDPDPEPDPTPEPTPPAPGVKPPKSGGFLDDLRRSVFGD